MSKPPPSAMEARFTIILGKPTMGIHEWLALPLIKASDVETNPGPTNTHKQVWICGICHKQKHGRKQISIRCNRIEHWVHQRCAGIRQAQYTDTWTCYLQRESELTPYLQTLVQTPTHAPPTLPQSKHRSNVLLFPQDW